MVANTLTRELGTRSGTSESRATAGSNALTLYVNIPFCKSKCAFCDYVQPIPKRDLLREASDPIRLRYIAALNQEISARQNDPLLSESKLTVIYWGGGTATNLEEDETRAISRTIHQVFDTSNLEEATMEGSPDTLTLNKLLLYKDIGITRISLGVQSFNDDRLRHLGRRHTVQDAKEAIHLTRRAGFHDLNIDIMCGLPDETPEEVENNIQQVLEAKPTHITLYPFRPTPGTVLRHLLDTRKRKLYVEKQKKAFHQGREMLSAAGYAEYASGYFGNPSLYNVRYFGLHTPLLGIGSGSISLYANRFLAHTKGALHSYLSAPTKPDTELPANSDAIILACLRAGLSSLNGISRSHWHDAIGESLDTSLSRPGLQSLLHFLRARGLIENRDGIYFSTDDLANVLIDLHFHLFLRQTAPRSS